MDEKVDNLPSGGKLGVVGGSVLQIEGRITEIVMKAMEAHPHSQDAAAKEAHMHKERYAYVRKLILMRDGWQIPQEDRDVVNSILEEIDNKRQISNEAKVKIRQLIFRNFAKRKPRAGVKKHRRRFEATILAISESCSSTTTLDLPQDLDRDEVIGAISTLATSMGLLSKLILSIVGEKEDQSD